jgi:hypothetical protein
MSELTFDHGANTSAHQARSAEGAPSHDRRADNQSIDRPSDGYANFLAAEDA